MSVGPISTLGGPFDRRKVLMVAIAVPKEEQPIEPGSFPKPHRMLTKELATASDKRYLFVEHRNGQPRTNSVLILGYKVFNQLRKKRDRIDSLHQGVLEVGSRSELEAILLELQ